MRRTRGHIPWSSFERRLRASREIWVATAGPVWFWWDGDAVYFATPRASRKAHNIARQPEVVLHNGDGAELARVDAAYRERYVDPFSGAHATTAVSGDVCFRVRPRRVTTWSYGDAGTRTDWEREP